MLLSQTPCVLAMIVGERATIKGEVVEVYDQPVADESVPIDELRKNLKAKIRIIDIIAEPEGSKTYNINKDRDEGSIVGVHELISKGPLAKGDLFIGELNYLLVEHHKYSYITKEVKLEVKQVMNSRQ